jgi:hypothetical protein
MPGEVYLQIEFADPRRPTARLAYGGIEIRNGKIRVPFSTLASAKLATEHMVVNVIEIYPVVQGVVLSDPPAIMGAKGKGDDNAGDQQQ